MLQDLNRPEVLKSQAMIRYQMKTVFGFDVVSLDDDKRRVAMSDFWHEVWPTAPAFEIDNTLEGILPVVQSALGDLREDRHVQFYVINSYSHYADWFLFGGKLKKKAHFKEFLDTFGDYKIIAENLNACSFDRNGDRLYARARILTP